MVREFERRFREREFGLPLSKKFCACLGLQPGLRGECKLAWCGGRCCQFGQCISPFIPTYTTVGGAPHSGDLAAQELELFDDFLGPLHIFVVLLVEVKGVDCDLVVNTCYTLNTTGLEFGYGPGRKVLKTRHTVLGRHTETGQPTALGLGSGQPTLQHQEVPGPSTGADRESASAAVEEDNLGGHHKKDKQSEGNRNARSCESRSRNRSGVVSRGTAQRKNTTSRESLYRCRRLGGSRRYNCTPWSGDMRDHATTRILVTDTRLWQ